MAWNHSSQRTSFVNENRGTDCCQVLTAMGYWIFRCFDSVAPYEYRMDVLPREALERTVSLLGCGCLQLAYCSFCLIVCLLFEPLSFDLLDGSTPLSRLI